MMDNKYNNKLKVPKTLNHQFAVWLSNINIIFIFVSHEYNKQILAVFLTTFSFNAILSFYDNQEHKHSKSMQNHTFENISCSTLLDNFLLLPNIIHCAQKEENRNIEKKISVRYLFMYWTTYTCSNTFYKGNGNRFKSTTHVCIGIKSFCFDFNSHWFDFHM